MMVKICGLKNPTDVANACHAGADAVGFVFAESVRRVTPNEAKQACTRLKEGVRTVAVMKHPSQSLVDDVMAIFAPDVLQTDADDLESLVVPTSVQTWPVYREGGREPGDESTFLYEGPKSGTGQTVDWQQASAMTSRGDMVLAGGLSPANVAEAIADVGPWGVDVSSGVESEPGVKDRDRIFAFVKAARAAEKEQ
ncbi:MAG: phosphoribosylanthranilate isomerase [Pseudomonadota bacterium]